MKNQTIEDNVRRLKNLLVDFDIAMLTTVQVRDGSLHSRPMMAQVSGFDGQLWFFSRFNSAKVDEIRAGSQVNLAYTDPSSGRYISISGTAYIERDRRKMQDLWSEIYRAWFPRGLDEPDVALLRIEVVEAELWDAATQATGERMRFQ
jgi:general stress protein 26